MALSRKYSILYYATQVSNTDRDAQQLFKLFIPSSIRYKFTKLVEILSIRRATTSEVHTIFDSMQSSIRMMVRRSSCKILTTSIKGVLMRLLRKT
uniref:Uncharacterized protein n=1 Tax=Ditylenchus dipsaci TaxID=166011 RepID=A0A915DA11_9BILA